MPTAEALSNIWLFSSLDEKQREQLNAFTFERRFSPGEIIVEEGRTGNGLYFITSGLVEVVRGASTATPRTLATLGKGEFFGEMALLEEWPRSATVRALEDTACIGIDRWLFLMQLRRDPDIAIVMLQAMARRLRETDARLAQ
jgi:CRP-like cAMP-binding protein